MTDLSVRKVLWGGSHEQVYAINFFILIWVILSACGGLLFDSKSHSIHHTGNKKGIEEII